MDDCASWRVSRGSRSMSAARTAVHKGCDVLRMVSRGWYERGDEGLLGISLAREPSPRDSHIYEQRPCSVVLKMACMLSSQWICWGRRVNLVAVSYGDPGLSFIFMLSTAAQSHLCGHESYQLSNSSTRSFSTPSSIIRNKTPFITARTQLDVDQPLKKWLIGYLAVCRKELNTDNEVRGAAVTLAGLISFKSPRWRPT